MHATKEYDVTPYCNRSCAVAGPLLAYTALCVCLDPAWPVSRCVVPGQYGTVYQHERTWRTHQQHEILRCRARLGSQRYKHGFGRQLPERHMQRYSVNNCRPGHTKMVGTRCLVWLLSVTVLSRPIQAYARKTHSAVPHPAHAPKTAACARHALCATLLLWYAAAHCVAIPTLHRSSTAMNLAARPQPATARALLPHTPLIPGEVP